MSAEEPHQELRPGVDINDTSPPLGRKFIYKSAEEREAILKDEAESESDFEHAPEDMDGEEETGHGKESAEKWSEEKQMHNALLLHRINRLRCAVGQTLFLKV